MPMYNVDLKCVEYGDKTETIYEDENILVKAISVEGNHLNFLGWKKSSENEW